MTEYGSNSIDQLFAVLDNLEPAFRDRVLTNVLFKVNRLPVPKSEDMNKPIKDILKPHLTYEQFRKSCENLCSVLPGPCIVEFIVTSLLRFWLTAGDSTRLGSVRENRKFIREALEADVANTGDPQGRRGRLIEMLQDDKQTLEQRVLDDYNIYIRVCDEIVRPLLLVAKR